MFGLNFKTTYNESVLAKSSERGSVEIVTDTDDRALHLGFRLILLLLCNRFGTAGSSDQAHQKLDRAKQCNYDCILALENSILHVCVHHKYYRKILRTQCLFSVPARLERVHRRSHQWSSNLDACLSQRRTSSELQPPVYSWRLKDNFDSINNQILQYKRSDLKKTCLCDPSPSIDLSSEAFISTTLYPACFATTWAKVVLPRPGGP